MLNISDPWKDTDEFGPKRHLSAGRNLIKTIFIFYFFSATDFSQIGGE